MNPALLAAFGTTETAGTSFRKSEPEFLWLEVRGRTGIAEIEIDFTRAGIHAIAHGAYVGIQDRGTQTLPHGLAATDANGWFHWY